VRPSMEAGGTYCTQYAHRARPVSLFLRANPAGVVVFQTGRWASAMTTNRCVAAPSAFVQPVENAGVRVLGMADAFVVPDRIVLAPERQVRAGTSSSKVASVWQTTRFTAGGGASLARVRLWTGSLLGCGMHGEARWSPGIRPNYQNVQECATVGQKVSTIDEYCQPCMILKLVFKWLARSGAGTRSVIG
jgi:hypothetical protein